MLRFRVIGPVVSGLLTVVLLLAPGLFAQDLGAPPSPGRGGARALDFFLGDWEVRLLGPDGATVGEARTHAYPILDGRAIQDDWRSIDGRGNVVFRGSSIRTWVPETGRWAVHWLMAEKPGYTYIDAEWRDGELHGTGSGFDDRGEFIERYRYFDITSDSYSLRVERRYGGEQDWGVTAWLSARKRANPAPPASTRSWDQWGGSRGDFSFDLGPIGVRWEELRPVLAWKRSLGPGYSAIVGWEDALFSMTADGQDELVVRIDATSGKTTWEFRYEPSHGDGGSGRRLDGGPQSTPLLVEGRLYTVGAYGDVYCLDADDGEMLWTTNLWERFGGNVLVYGYASSPIRFGDALILLTGGPGATVVALDLLDGETLWQAHDFKNGYSTPMVHDISGRPELITFTQTELISADPRDGTLHWSYPVRGSNVVRPIWHADSGTLFLSSSGKRAGARGLSLERPGAPAAVVEKWTDPSVHFYYGNAVRVGDLAIGASAETDGYYLAAIHMPTGEVRWRDASFASATLLASEERLIILDEAGELVTASAAPDRLVVHSRTSGASPPARTPPTVLGARIYLRDQKNVMAYDLQ